MSSNCGIRLPCEVMSHWKYSKPGGLAFSRGILESGSYSREEHEKPQTLPSTVRVEDRFATIRKYIGDCHN